MLHLAWRNVLFAQEMIDCGDFNNNNYHTF